MSTVVWAAVGLWLLAGAAVVAILIGGANERVDRGLEELNAPARVCGIRGCTRPADAVYGHHPSGPLWICTAHAHQWSGPDHVYDRELDGTDLAAWDQEVES